MPVSDPTVQAPSKLYGGDYMCMCICMNRRTPTLQTNRHAGMETNPIDQNTQNADRMQQVSCTTACSS